MDVWIFMKCSVYVGYDTRNNLDHLGDGWCNWPLGHRIHFSIFWVRVCWRYHGETDGWIFMKFSGHGHKKQQATLFHAWMDCFTLLKLGAVEVCALGVLLFGSVLLLGHLNQSESVFGRRHFCRQHHKRRMESDKCVNTSSSCNNW